MAGYEIIQTQNKGRSMFATQAFKPDDTILQETPFVSCQFSWNSAYKYRACEYCIRPLETAENNVQRLTGVSDIVLPYPECCETIRNIEKQTACPGCGTEYCSELCRQEAAQKYHSVMCLKNRKNDLTHPINKLIEGWKKIHYPPETTTISFIIKLLGMYLQSTDKNVFVQHLNEFQNTIFNEDLTIAHKILGPNFEPQLSALFELYCEAFQSADLSLFLTPEAFRTFFVIMGTNGQGIGSSAFANWVKNTEHQNLTSNEKDALNTFIDDIYEKLELVTGLQFLNNEGSALYKIQSKINHSCLPNAASTFPDHNHNITIKAVENIEPGEEICISYLDECFLNRSRHSRQKELMENYLFLCRCCKCELQINDPDISSEEEEDIELDDNSDYDDVEP